MINTADRLFHLLQSSGQKVITFNRAEFEAKYRRLAETQRMLQARLDSTLEPFNIVVAFGTNAVIVASDSNFSQAPKDNVCHCHKGPPGASRWECPLHGEFIVASTDSDQKPEAE